MDTYRIDSHKLMFHVSRVQRWLEGETIYPIYMEISPSGSCNHRCTYCGLDFMGYRKRFLETEILKARLTELGRLGLKSVMYAGEGEPFLHEDLPSLISHTRQSGIDAAITTNAVLFKPEYADEILSNSEWLKVSINGATPQTYVKIHRTRAEDFDTVISNMTYAAQRKREQNYTCTLGMQLLLLPENAHEAVRLAELARDIEMDYLVIKPYSQHPQSKTQKYQDLTYCQYQHLAEELELYNTESFRVIYRLNTMKKWDRGERDYDRCKALPFWSYIDAGGNVWGCSVFMEREEFLYGNIYENTFAEIWEGPKRAESLQWFDQKFDPSRCRINCRMDEINRYLWELKHPPAHVNFI